jgi:hypothetical protein
MFRACHSYRLAGQLQITEKCSALGNISGAFYLERIAGDARPG